MSTEKTKVVICGGRGSSKTISAFIAAGFDVEEWNGNHPTEAEGIPLGLMDHSKVFSEIRKDNSRFIQQKMQGKRRVY